MEQRINDKLDQLSEYYEELTEDLPSANDFLSKRILRRGIEKSIELIVETVIDISNIIISSRNLEKPPDSKGSIEILAKEKIISKPLCEKIKDMISFRNILVHRYSKLDEKEEFVHIQENHSDIMEFIKEIDNFLKK